jgi:hypothetical protein
VSDGYTCQTSRSKSTAKWTQTPNKLNGLYRTLLAVWTTLVDWAASGTKSVDNRSTISIISRIKIARAKYKVLRCFVFFSIGWYNGRCANAQISTSGSGWNDPDAGWGEKNIIFVDPGEGRYCRYCLTRALQQGYRSGWCQYKYIFATFTASYKIV